MYLWLFLVAGLELLLQTLTNLSLAQLAFGFEDTLSEALNFLHLTFCFDIRSYRTRAWSN